MANIDLNRCEINAFDQRQHQKTNQAQKKWASLAR